MNKTKLSWTISAIEKMHEKKETLSFDHPIQRKSEIWSEQQKSLLIHSMLANYPVPHIYVLREDSKEVDKNGKPVFNYFVLDGKQRLSSTLSYIWGEFELSENIQNIKIEDEEYELAGKYFADLDKEVQFELLHYKFDIIAFEECSNREVEEIFLRLNNGSALSKAQMAKAKAGVQVAVLLNELMESKFIKEICFFTKQQIAKSEDQRCILQAMMLFDRNLVPNFEFKDFSEQVITEYAESLNGNYTAKQADVIRSAVEYLSNAFQEKNKNLKKISVPMILYTADVAINQEISPRQFCKWYDYFTTKDNITYENYKYFGNSGSTKMEKINGRLAVMIESFCKFLELDLPEELMEIVQSTKKLLEERDALLADKETADTEGQAEQALTVAGEEPKNAIPFAEEELADSVTAEQAEDPAKETDTSEAFVEEADTAVQEETAEAISDTSEETSVNTADQTEDETDQAEDITSNAE